MATPSRGTRTSRISGFIARNIVVSIARAWTQVNRAIFLGIVFIHARMCEQIASVACRVITTINRLQGRTLEDRNLFQGASLQFKAEDTRTGSFTPKAANFGMFADYQKGLESSRIQALSGLINKLRLSASTRTLAIFAVVAVLAPVGALSLGLLSSNDTQAAAGINDRLNFQARLLTSAGGVVDDGNYNVEFKIYQDGDGDLGGGDETLLWTESHLNDNSQGITIKNGYLSAQLGGITALSAVDFNQDTIWLSLNIGDTATSCTPFSNCTPDGEMDPFMRFTATPYSFNSDELDGLDSTDFVQLGQGTQTDSGATTSISINQTGGAALLDLQVSGSQVLGLANNGNLTLTGNFLPGTDDTYDLGATGSRWEDLYIGDDSGIHVGTAAGDDYTIGYDTSNNTLEIQANVDAVQGFQVLDTDGGTPILNIDTTNERLGIGTAAPESAFNVVGTATFGDASSNAASLVLYDANGDNVTINVEDLADDFVLSIPDSTAGTDTLCLETLANCTASGADQSVATYVVAASDSVRKDGADYEGDGDTGTANDGDQIEINQALTALGSTGGVVYLLEGTYVIDNPIEIEEDNTTIIGAGPGTIITLDDTYNDGDITFITEDSTDNPNNITIRDLRLHGNDDNVSDEQNAITIDNVDGGTGDGAVNAFTIENVEIDEFSGNGIYTTYVTNGTITDNVISDVAGTAVSVYQNSSNVYVSNNRIFNANIGVYAWNGTSDVTIHNNVIENSGAHGIALVNRPSNFIITNNIVKGGTNGIYIDASTFYDGYHNVSNNTIISPSQYGIFVDFARYTTIQGNIIDGDSDDTNTGVYSVQTQHLNIVDNNVHETQIGIHAQLCNNCSIYSNTTYDTQNQGINVQQTNYTSFTGNSIESTGGNGIDIEYSDNNIISNNTIESFGDTYNGIELNDLVTDGSDGNLLVNNYIYDGSTTSGVGIYIATYGSNNILQNNIMQGVDGAEISDNATDNSTLYIDQMNGDFETSTTDLQIQAPDQVQILSDTTITGTLNLTVSDLGASDTIGAFFNVSTTDNSQDQSGLYGLLDVNPSGASTYQYTGTVGATTSASSNVSSAQLIGVGGTVVYSGTSTLGQADGIFGQIDLTNASGTITDAAGLRAASPDGGSFVGTIDNLYGLYVEDQSGATNNYGIYVADAEDYSLYLASTDNDAASGITFGGDTNLYRSGADTLTTDDSLNVLGQTLTVSQSGADGIIQIEDGDGTGSVSLTVANPGSDITITLPDALAGSNGECLLGNTDGTTSFGSCGGTITLQNAYDDSTGGTTPEIKVDSTRGALTIQDADTTISGNLLEVRDSNGSGAGDVLFSVDSTGQAVFATADTDSVTAFQIQDADGGTSVFNVDTVNERVGIGDDSPDYTLDVVGNTTDEDAGAGVFLDITTVNHDRSFNTGTTSRLTVSPDAASTSSFYGIYGQAQTSSANVTGAYLIGVQGSTDFNGTGTLGEATGVAGVAQNLSTGTITDAIGLRAYNPVNSGGGTVTNAYGLYVSDITSGTNDYGIRVDGADTYALWLGAGADNTDAANGITFGMTSGTSVNLYRGGDNILKSDDSLEVVGSITTGDASNAGSLVVHEGDGNAITITSGDQNASYTVQIPDTLVVGDEFCLLTADNCGVGNDQSVATIVVAASDSTRSAGADYTAAGTGSDEDAINSAIGALPAAGGVIYLLEGTYDIDASIVIDDDDTVIRGAGRGTIITSTSGNTFDYIHDSTNNPVGIEIRDLTLYGNDDSQGGTQHGIVFDDMAGGSSDGADRAFLIDNVYIDEFNGEGITIDNVDNATVSNSVLTDFATNQAHIVINQGSTNISVDNNLFVSGQYGVSIATAGTQEISVTNNTFEQIGIYGIVSQNADNITIDGNKIEGNNATDWGIYFLNGAESHVAISNNTINDTLYDGIYAQNIESISITGNTIDDTGQAGIDLNQANRCSITGNNISNTGTSQNGIAITYGRSCTVTGNIINDSGGSGISSLGSLYTSISSNTIYNAALHGISVTAAHDNGVISNNAIDTYGATYDGISLDNSDENLIIGNTIQDASGSGYAIQLSSNSQDNVLSNNIYNGSGASSIDDASSTTVYSNQLNDDVSLATSDLVIQAQGEVDINSDTNVTGSLSVVHSDVDTSDPYTIYAQGTTTDATADITSVYGLLTVNPGSASTQSYYGTAGVAVSSSSNVTNATLVGTAGIVQYSGTSTLGQADGIAGQIDQSNASGTITDAAAIRAQSPLSLLGTVDNLYGLYVEDQSGGTNNYGIYVADAEDYSLYLASTDGDAASGITFGGGYANLYSSADGVLKTDDNLLFGEDANRTISLEQISSDAVGRTLTISAGQGGAGTGQVGGVLALQGGAAGGTNANGGNITLTGGVGTGTGVNGLVVISNPTVSTASTQNCTGSPCAITQANVDSYGSVLITTDATGYTVTLGDPTITTAGRMIYITNADATDDFTLSANAGAETITLKPSTTATMIWSGSDWTAAGASSSTDLQAAYDNTAASAGAAELILNAPGGNADGLTIRNNETTPIEGALLEVQASIGNNLFAVNNFGTEYAANGGAEDSTGFSTDWTDNGSATSSRDTTAGDFATGLASVEVVTTALADDGVVNNLDTALTASTTYQVSFTGQLDSGAAFTTLEVIYSRDGGTDEEACTNYSTQTLVTTNWSKVTCDITTDGSAATDADLIIRQSDAQVRNFNIDNLSIRENSASSTPPNVQIGGGENGGAVTLFTLDQASSPPVASGDSTYYGSMYYDTVTGRIQCYEADGWGACGSPPNNIITITPEYAGAVLNGTGVGTMSADFCSDESGVLQVNDTLCDSGEAVNYYEWTSPQASSQTYSIYLTFQLPTTFESFYDNDTITLDARTTDTSDADVDYEIFRSTGSAITECGSDTTVTTSNDTWQTVTHSGDEYDGCSFAAGDRVIFKINMTARNNDSVYVSDINFTYTNE